MNHARSTKSPSTVARLAVLLAIGCAATVRAGESADKAAPDHKALEAAGWPCWRGPTGSGSAADCKGEVVEDIADAQWTWNGEDRHPVEYNGTCSKLTGSGCVSPIFWNNRVYMVYHSASALRRLDAETIGHTYVRPGQKPIVLAPERRKQMVAGYCGAKGQHTAKLDSGSPYTEEMAENFLFNLYNDDVAVCLDADSGRILWRTRFLSHFKGQTGSYHNSPCIDGGRLYVLTPGETRILCLDALTGELLWDRVNNQNDTMLRQSLAMRERLLSRAKLNMGNAGIQHSIVVDGCLVCAAGVFDAATGRRIGDGQSVATRWTHKGKEHLLAGDSCYDVRTGKVLWSAKGINFGMGRNSGGNPAVTENHMVAWVRGEGWCGYRMGLDGVKQLWSMPELKHSTGAAVIHKGYAATGASDPKGRLLIAVNVETGEVAGKCYYDQKGSKNFPPSPLNNLWCGITSAVATDGHVFWRRFRSGGGGLTMMTLPVDGRKFSVSIKDGPLLGYSHTPAAGDGRLFVRMKGYMRCLDFRKNPPPASPPPSDPACKGLKGALARLGAAHKSDRDSAVAELTKSADAAAVPELIRLLTEGRYPTVQAAAATLGRAPSIGAAAAAALKALLEDKGGQQPATRLGLQLRALHAAGPEEGAAVTRALLRKAAAAGDQKLLARLGDALAQPVFANDIGLVKAVLPDVKAALATADETALDATGSALGNLDLEPEALTPLVGEMIAAIRRTQSTSVYLQRALLIGLEKCEDEATFKQAAAFALDIWPEATHRGWDGSTVFQMAVLGACPGKVAEAALPKLILWSGRDASIFARIGTPAIDALAQQCRKTDGKTRGRILGILNEMGPEGEKAAKALEEGEAWPPIR